MTLEYPGSALRPLGRDDIARLTTAEEIAQRLTLVDEAGKLRPGPFAVIEFDTPGSGIASPIRRTTDGFVGFGQTSGGAREFVIPNLPIDDLLNLTAPWIAR